MIFDTIKLSIVMYTVLLVASLFVLAGIAGLIVWDYYLGRPLAPFFWYRIIGWFDRRIAVFEVFTLSNTISFVRARRERGDGFRIQETSKTPVTSITHKKSRLETFINKHFPGTFPDTPVSPTFDTRDETRFTSLIVPKTSYSINGVNVVPIMDLHPKLHPDVEKGVTLLISSGINTLDELRKICAERPEIAQGTLFGDYTYERFLDLYESTAQKYQFSVDTFDVMNFVTKHIDKNYSENIVAKDFNAQNNLASKKDFSKLGYIAIIIAAVIVGIRVLYLTFA